MRVDVPLPAPDQALVRPGQHLDRLGQRAVAGDLAVVVPVGADQVGQHLGIPAVGLRPRAAVPAAVAADGLWVDRIDLATGGQQRSDQQAPVGLNADRDLRRVLGMAGQQGVQLTHACQAVKDPTDGQHGAVLVQQAQVMVALAPVDPKEQHGVLLCSGVLSVSPEKDLRRPNGSAHRHDIPPAVRPPYTGRGTLSPENSRGSEASECSPAGSSAIASHRRLGSPIRGLPPDPLRAGKRPGRGRYNPSAPEGDRPGPGRRPRAVTFRPATGELRHRPGPAHLGCGRGRAG